LFSRDFINERLPYDRRTSILERRASFIGSTNNIQFLSDDTGSVRWLCFEIESINWKYNDEIDIDLVYAQAYHLYQSNKI
jgi:predicted P-loop ATPase